jgi:hypothetical protein
VFAGMERYLSALNTGLPQQELRFAAGVGSFGEA